MEKCYFPMPTLAISQGYNVGTHLGSFALDMIGEDGGIDWVYAPFTGTIKAIDTKNGNFVWLESNEPVQCANGVIDYLTMMLGHCNMISGLKVGQVIKQWTQFYAEGTAGKANGNHCHMELGRGKYQGEWYKNTSGVWMMYNAVKPNEYLWLKKGTIKRAPMYDWKYEDETVIDPKDKTILDLQKQVSDLQAQVNSFIPIQAYIKK